MANPTASVFDQAVYSARISKAQQLIQLAGLGGIVIGEGTELNFLTGLGISSHERLSALVIPANGLPRLIVPATDAPGLDTPVAEIIGWRDGQNPYLLCATYLNPGPVGVGSNLTADHVLRLQAVAGPTILAQESLAELFMVKEEGEIAQLRAAAQAIDQVHARVPALLQPGRSESEVAAELETLILSSHEAVDFIIVGSGPNGANPHHSYSERVLESGDPVVVDIGGTLASGYHSDCTRTYQVGTVDDSEFLRAYDVLERAQDAAVDAVKPGVTAGEVDAIAREIITNAGYGEMFFHRTGHGIGLVTHEAPYIIAGSTEVLRESMVFSIEPGIYFPDAWGMRIEDIVEVTATGCTRLNKQPRCLQ